MSIDGIGAYDHVFRSAMLAKLHDEPRLHGLLTFVRALYSERSCSGWQDSEGAQHPTWQGEGGEKEDPLMLIAGREARHATRRGVVCVPR